MSGKVIGAGMIEAKDNDEIWGLNRRWVLFSNALLINMIERIEAFLGPVAKRQIYEVGYSSGQLGGQRMREIFKGGIEQFKQHVGLSTALGWGTIKTVDYDEKSGDIILEYINTWEYGGHVEVHGDKKTKNPTCIFSVGLAAGAAEGAFEKPYEAVEELCMSKGDPVCRFNITPIGEKRAIIR
jgi:predicted hydrocarbon binding protein